MEEKGGLSMNVKQLVNDISVNTQSSICINLDDLTIYFDPFEIKEENHDADLILITHEHYDHYSPDDYRKLTKEDTVFIAPESMQADFEKDGITSIKYMKPNDTLDFKGISVTALPAYNDMHKKEHGWLGYLLNIDGIILYNTGDCGKMKEVEHLHPDILMLPIGGTFTIDATQAAQIVNKMHPQVVIPIHYGSIVGNPKDADVLEKNVDQDIQVVRKLQFNI